MVTSLDIIIVAFIAPHPEKLFWKFDNLLNMVNLEDPLIFNEICTSGYLLDSKLAPARQLGLNPAAATGVYEPSMIETFMADWCTGKVALGLRSWVVVHIEKSWDFT